jgi:hypothetical protein
VPETIALREGLLPHESRQRTFAGSALDEAWLDEVDAGRGLIHGCLLPQLAGAAPARRLMLSIFSARFADRR